MNTSQIELTSEIMATLVDSMGNDESVVHAARVSIVGARAETESGERKGLLDFLMRNSHNSPFEHVTATFLLEVPIFVTREIHRHRTFCLPAGTLIYQGAKPSSYQWKPIEQIWDNWNNGVPDSLGRRRKLPSVYDAPYRTLNEDTLLFESSRIADVWKTGEKDLLKITAGGRTLRCSVDHLIFTPDGYVKACDLRVGDQVGTMGRRADFENFEGPKIIPSLRRGINEWTQQLRNTLIPNEYDNCTSCLKEFAKEDLRLDHEIPIVLDIKRALDIDNLRIVCRWCHRIKTSEESKYASRPIMNAGCQWQEISSIVSDGREECFDIEMSGPWNNFIADGFIVHNSYNEVSGRYSILKPKFYAPNFDRPLHQVGKPGQYSFELGTDDEMLVVWRELRHSYQTAWNTYEFLLDEGVAKEVARDVLPVGIYTSFYMTGNLRNWMSFLALRTAPDALFEIREVAGRIEEGLFKIAPTCMELWDKSGRRSL